MAELHHPHATHPAHAGDNPDVHHEESDVNIRGVLMFGGGLIVAAIVIHLVVGVLFKYFDVREARQATPEYPLAAAQENRLPPEPRLQTNPRQDLADLRVREDEALAGYSWVDRNAGIVRIPIDEAIKKTLARGLPARTEQKK
jgi:hypothetical protein